MHVLPAVGGRDAEGKLIYTNVTTVRWRKEREREREREVEESVGKTLLVSFNFLI